jgi:hypothetical protein
MKKAFDKHPDITPALHHRVFAPIQMSHATAAKEFELGY